MVFLFHCSGYFQDTMVRRALYFHFCRLLVKYPFLSFIWVVVARSTPFLYLASLLVYRDGVGVRVW